jgi:hypothetical protein
MGEKKLCMRGIVFGLLWLAGLGVQGQPAENVILVTFDGFRWQEVFHGADTSLMKQQKFLKDDQVREKYWRTETEARRKALLPFIWTTVATQGQIHGNRTAGSHVNVTNTMWFSYPGYQEILSGFADDARVTSNDKVYNPNETVLEYLHKQPGFHGKVAAFTSWDVFPFIINDRRSGVYVNSGEVAATQAPITEREQQINLLMTSTPNMLHGVRLDAFTFYYSLEYLRKNKPKVLYLSFDETDDFAHSGEYAGYLNAANKTDRFLAELWEFVQSDPAYKNKTTLVITTDHGRGPGAEDWKSHGAKVKGADEIWIAMIGPGIAPTGESKSGQRQQNQVAATLAACLGIRYAPKQVVGQPLK